MTSPAPRTRRWLRWATVPVAVALSSILVWQSSNAAFSSTTENPTSSWAAGTVALSDDDAGTALFTATGLKPGSTGTKCIVVASTGSLPSLVKMYGRGLTAPNALSNNLNLTVTQGSGGSFGSCTGFVPAETSPTVYDGVLSAFSATSYADGYDNWTTAGTGSESRTYRFVYLLALDTPNAAQGQTASIGFTWEAQHS